MLHDIAVTAEQIQAVAAWAVAGPDAAPVLLALSDRHGVLNAAQGDERASWDAAGKPVD